MKFRFLFFCYCIPHVIIDWRCVCVRADAHQSADNLTPLSPLKRFPLSSAHFFWSNRKTNPNGFDWICMKKMAKATFIMTSNLCLSVYSSNMLGFQFHCAKYCISAVFELRIWESNIILLYSIWLFSASFNFVSYCVADTMNKMPKRQNRAICVLSFCSHYQLLFFVCRLARE